MSRRLTVIVLFLFFPLMTGFIFSKSKVEIIKGVWKSEQPMEGVTRFIIIRENAIEFEGNYVLGGLVFEEKDGVVIFRAAGYEPTLGRILIQDDTHITVESTGQNAKLVRSNENERREALTPPVSKVIGHYVNSDGSLIFQIKEKGVFKNGEPIDGDLTSENRQYSFIVGDNVLFKLVPTADGTLQYLESSKTETLVKKSDEEITELRTTRAKAQQAEQERVAKALEASKERLIKARGTWAMKSPDPYSKWRVMKISKNSLVMNDKTIPIVGKVVGENAVLCTDNFGPTVLTIKWISDDGNQLTVAEAVGTGLMSRDEEYTYERTTPEEIALRNNTQSIAVQQSSTGAGQLGVTGAATQVKPKDSQGKPQSNGLRGFWKLEGDAPVCRILAFDTDRAMRDGHVEPIEIKTDNSAVVRIMRPGTHDMYELMRVSHSGNDTINVRFGRYESDGWFTYRRLPSDQIKMENQRTNNVIGKMAGYWKSVEPVTEGRNGYISIKLNQYDKNVLVDVFEFLDVTAYNKGTAQRNGFLGYEWGKTDKPLFRISDDGRLTDDRFEFTGDNQMVYKYAGEKPVVYVRISEADATPLIEKRRK